MLPAVLCALGIYLIRCLTEKLTFWGSRYLRQGWRLLHSESAAFCLLDTAAVWGVLVMAFYAFRFRPALAWLAASDGFRTAFFLVLLALGSLPFRKSGVFFGKEGVLVIKPFQAPRLVPWQELGAIQRGPGRSKYNILRDRAGRRLAVFRSGRKTQPFFALARQNGIEQGGAKWF